MDRPLNNQTLLQNKRKQYMKIGIPIAGLALIFLAFSAWIRPSVDRKNILTARVEKGTVEETISASGTVVPSFEQSVSSPTETRVLSIRKRPGERVKQGESVLDLDRSESKLTLDKVEKECALKANQRTQLRLDMERTLRDLKGQLNIKNLRLQYLRSKTSQSEKLLELGAISKDQMDQARLEEHIATIEKEELEQSVETTTKSLENQLSSLTTEVTTLEKERTDAARQFELLACKADRNGVVTWVNEQIGTSVHRGEVVARIADLGSYNVDATLSDIHASRVYVGMPANVRINDVHLPAKILTVYPTIENGVAKVTLALPDSAHRILRPSQRVDVFLVVSRKENTLRVRKGPFVNGIGRQDVFVIRGTTAYREAVIIGVTSFDNVSIDEGLNEGDEVIISDMNDFKQQAQIKVH